MGHHREEFDRQRELLVGEARAASHRNKSYRDFQVGCAVLAWNGDAYRVFLGANAKPLADGPKICAEQVAVMAAIAAGFDTIVAIVVAGIPQPDGASGIDTPTLHPCWVCRNLLGSILPAETIVVTVHNHVGPTHDHTLGEIIALHHTHHSH